MNSESREDQLDRIQSEIRADAETARGRARLPERAAANPHGATAASTSIAELARHDGPAFVDKAYREILGRAPDAEGFARQMALLGAGASKVELIGDLRYSAEGKERATPIAGLRPRYLLTKLTRIPVAGTLLQWLIALASLPHMLRHQRATQASLAVRFGETAAALSAAEQRNAELGEAIDAVRSDLSNAVAELSERIARAEGFAQALNANVVELRQLALTMNHWTVQVRKSIDAIEAAEAEQRARDDEASAAMIRRARERDTMRAERLQAWAGELARRLPPNATVLDLCGGADWLALLNARGWDASSIETNSALHRDARAHGLNVTLGNPSSLLPRIADASLDAMSITSLDRVRDIRAAALLREAQRVLRRGGAVLIDLHSSERTADSVIADVAATGGFGDPQTLDVHAGKALVFART
ncbi:MAG TPA: hypothetical protein VH375_09000 [Rhodanobacteraceae bacterium]